MSPRAAQRPGQPARHPGLADLGAGAGDQRPGAQGRGSHRARRRQPRSARAATSRSTCSSVWAADSATRRRRRARRRPSAAGSPAPAGPASSSAAAAASAARLVAEHHRHDRRRVAGPQPVDVAPQAGHAARRPRPSGRPAARPGRRPCRPGVGAVVKMNGRARLTQQVDVAAGARRRTRRASRAPWTACRRAARSRPVAARVDLGAEHGVGLVEHQQRAVARRTARPARRRRRRRRPSRRRVSVTTSARAVGAVAEQLGQVVEVAVAVDARRRRGPGGRRRRSRRG